MSHENCFLVKANDYYGESRQLKEKNKRMKNKKKIIIGSIVVVIVTIYNRQHSVTFYN